MDRPEAVLESRCFAERTGAVRRSPWVRRARGLAGFWGRRSDIVRDLAVTFSASRCRAFVLVSAVARSENRGGVDGLRVMDGDQTWLFSAQAIGFGHCLDSIMNGWSRVRVGSSTSRPHREWRTHRASNATLAEL